jgi:hypothetical protein
MVRHIRRNRASGLLKIFTHECNVGGESNFTRRFGEWIVEKLLTTSRSEITLQSHSPNQVSGPLKIEVGLAVDVELYNFTRRIGEVDH